MPLSLLSMLKEMIIFTHAALFLRSKLTNNTIVLFASFVDNRPIMMQSDFNGTPAYYYDDDDGYVDEDDEDMPETERELAEDAQWKLIQKNTFTRWANEQLKNANMSVTDLTTDLSDGLRLAALVEVLSGCKFRSINKRPNFRTQKLENVTQTLRYLEENEGIRLVNIGKSQFLWVILVGKISFLFTVCNCNFNLMRI